MRNWFAVAVLLALSVLAVMLVAPSPDPDAPPAFLDLSPSGVIPASAVMITSLSDSVDISGATEACIYLSYLGATGNDNLQHNSMRRVRPLAFVSHGRPHLVWSMAAVDAAAITSGAKQPDCPLVYASQKPARAGSELMFAIVCAPGDAFTVILDTGVKRSGKWTMRHTRMRTHGPRARVILPPDFQV